MDPLACLAEHSAFLVSLAPSLRLDLDPVALAGLVGRIFALGDNALEAVFLARGKQL